LPKPGTNKDPNHLPHPLSPTKRGRVARARPGDALYSYTSGTGRAHGNWRRLRPEELAPTVTGHARFIHPFEDRLLTVREHARMMGFPDSFIFRGGRDIQYDVVGEAVPPPLARAIALTIKPALDETLRT
jgi:DNA (cytosine-5)-methyltransferase 1